MAKFINDFQIMVIMWCCLKSCNFLKTLFNIYKVIFCLLHNMLCTCLLLCICCKCVQCCFVFAIAVLQPYAMVDYLSSGSCKTLKLADTGRLSRMKDRPCWLRCWFLVVRCSGLVTSVCYQLVLEMSTWIPEPLPRHYLYDVVVLLPVHSLFML